jgi:hypothetical protein
MLGSSTAPRGLTASTALSASTRAASWPHVLEHDAEARRLNDALAFAHQLREPPVCSVGDDEIGTEKKQKRFRHLRAQAAEQ